MKGVVATVRDRLEMPGDGLTNALAGAVMLVCLRSLPERS